MQLRAAAFLFDLDGVLVDSRAVVERTWRRWGERHRLDVEPILRIAHGRRARDTLNAVVPHLATDQEVRWLDDTELADVEGLRPVPGAVQFLASLPAGSWTIVTSCGRALAELRLTSVGLSLPPLIVTAEDASRGKPAPDGYLIGAWRLGHPASTCVVFEDAPPGVAAGLAAGARVIALSTTQPDADFTGAEAVIPDFRGIHVLRDHDAFVIKTK